MADVTFDDLGDQLASMLGADTASELPDTDKKRMGTVLFVLVEAIRKVSILLNPIIPDSSLKVLD